ncbi:polysaccharide deacetylase family protein [Sporosarcina limicola]|uniref:Peptidoglycan/xylan/chitin deacetylase (PgdA/CDA1 family) n=1 Tax=Sporosarcina limicola TaxID=34101 RepID=A0A927MMZ6_9BACL|nr:polysaccharide deacetylase family protein [Sporosarcina limicola]MBE1554439.1 peptidoglycan/xylan/chitin deacetylase (PgdA/CDA1 family) [Sporosarcina limicola]
MKKTHRKRRSSWIDITFSIAIIFLTVAAIYLISQTTKNEAAPLPDKKKSSASTPVLVDTIDSNYPGIKIVTETSNDTYFPFAIQYPQSLHNPFNDEIAGYIKNAKQSYLAAMEESKRQNSKHKGELNISFETLSHHSGNYSFVLIDGRFVGGANGTTEIRSFHLNPKTGHSATIEDVLGNDLKSLEKISTLVREHLHNDSELKDYLFTEDVAVKTAPIWKNFSNFALTDESIIFYFDEYELAAGAVGPTIVPIPIIDVNELLASEFKMKRIGKDATTKEDKQKDSETGENEETTPPDETNSPTDQDDKDNGQTESVGKKVALTFDDGPDPKVTMQILATLEKYEAKATFFMLGSRVEFYPQIAKNVQEAGHELANHSWNHPDLTKQGVEKIRSEINDTSAIIEKVTGAKVTGFRPPYGAVNKTVRAQSNLNIVLWDVDTLDWKHRNPVKLLQNVKAQTRNGSIILMHDIHQSTADGLDAVLAYLHGEGYSFVTVAELESSSD